MNDGKKQSDRPETIQERIRDLAYFMWEAGGRQHGRALEYWLEAERVFLSYRHDGAPAETGNPPAKVDKEAKSPEKQPPKNDNGGG